MAFNPNVPVVAPGDLITSAHINNIRANLDRLDTTGLDLTGGVVTGTIQVGGDPTAVVAGMAVRPDGVLISRVQQPSSLVTPNLQLNRAGTPTGDVGCEFIEFRRAAAAGSATAIVGSITMITGPGTAYNTTCDGRLKDDLGPIDDPAGVIAALRPRHLAWKAGGEEFDGFIAQDVAQVVPDAVSGDPGGDPNTAPLQLDVSRLVPYLVAAVQALTERVADLEAL